MSLQKRLKIKIVLAYIYLFFTLRLWLTSQMLLHWE